MLTHNGDGAAGCGHQNVAAVRILDHFVKGRENPCLETCPGFIVFGIVLTGGPAANSFNKCLLKGCCGLCGRSEFFCHDLPITPLGTVTIYDGLVIKFVKAPSNLHIRQTSSVPGSNGLYGFPVTL